MAFDQRKYNRAYYRRHAARLKQMERDRYHRQKNDPEFQLKAKLGREVRHYGVPMSVVFRKTSGKCWFCGKRAQLVHHLDGQGRTIEKLGRKPSHNLKALVPACRACHLEAHRAAMMLVKKTRANGYWSRRYNACIECGTTKRRHQGHGLCNTCAMRRARRKKRQEARV